MCKVIILLFFFTINIFSHTNNSDQARELYWKGEKLSREGKFQEAISLYKKSIDLNSDNISNYSYDSYCGIGNIFMNLKEYDNAIENFEKAKSINNNEYLAYERIVHAYKYKKDFKNAIKSLEELINKFKIDSRLGGFLMIFYAQVNDWKKVEETAYKVINIDDVTPTPYSFLAVVYLTRGEDEKALEFYTKSAKLSKKENFEEVGNQMFEKGKKFLASINQLPK